MTSSRIAVLVMGIVLSLSGCSRSNDGNDRPSPEPLAEPPPQPVLYEGSLLPFVASSAASSFDGVSCAPEAAFDENLETAWRSGPEQSGWLEITFDRPLRIEEIIIQWSETRASAFAVFALTESGDRLELARRTNAVGDVDSLPLIYPAQALGLRFECLESQGQGFGIREVIVNGSARGTASSQAGSG